MRDQEELARILHDIEGKVCLSYYSHPKVDELYPGWSRDRKEVPAYSAMSKRGEAKPRRTELLIMNF